MAEEPRPEELVESMVSHHNALGELYGKLVQSETYTAIRTLANTVKRQAAEIAALKAELKGKAIPVQSETVAMPSANLKRRAACFSPSRCLPQTDGFVFVKKPKLTPLSQDSKPDTQSLTALKDTPTRRDKFTRAERKLLPGYSTPESDGFYKAFAGMYEEQEVKNKVSEHRYEYPPAKVPSSFYKLDI